MSEKQPLATPQDYAEIFEDNRVGQRVFEDLIVRFGGVNKKGEGIDRVLNAFEFQGRRAVIEFITLRINQANGVEHYDNQPSIET